MVRQVINSSDAAAVGPYSHAVRAGELLILSGQTPIEPATGRLLSGSVAQQTDQCLNNLMAVLANAGLTSDDVVSVQVYLIDMADFNEMNTAYAAHFTKPYPARTTIGCSSLPVDARVEIALMGQMRRIKDAEPWILRNRRRRAVAPAADADRFYAQPVQTNLYLTRIGIHAC